MDKSWCFISFSIGIEEKLMNTDVILADNHRIFVEGLSCILSKREDLSLVATANNGIDLIKKVREHSPKLVILELNIPGKDGLECLDFIKRNFRSVKVLILSMYNQAKFVKQAVQSGVDGYVLKTADSDELFRAIDEIIMGERYLGKGVSLANDDNVRKSRVLEIYDDNFVKKYNLTKREIEILLLITDAKSNKEIAKDLFISDQTVSVHRKNMMRKLGVGNTAGLIRFAYEKSLI
jgi:DNA-binding NarL/FixJ family response regulator